MEKWRDSMINMLRYMTEKGASDLHISAGVPPYIRVSGTIVPTEFPALSKDECQNLLFSFLTEEEKNEFYKQKTLDFPFGESAIGRFRINVYLQRGSLAGAIRRLPVDVPTLEELGLPVDAVKYFCSCPNGLVLVCGATGNGKTTTLASMVDYINKNRNCHIITIEDPVEYVYKNIKSIIHQREIRRDAPNFADALKYILREDPDVVVIGEMRDLETISSAVTIAETGHLVLATLHTVDTSESIRRITDVFPAVQQLQIALQLSNILLGVMNQVLLPRSDGPGRALATEVMLVDPAIQNLIRENKIEQIYSHIQMGSSYGMNTLNQSLAALVAGNVISREMAISKTKRTKELLKLIGIDDA